jgi:PII-like signaling protein
MMLSGEGVLLRIFIGEADKVHGRPLSEVIVQTARRHGMAGATAWKGFMGFGAHSRMHTAKVLRLSTDLPVIIEIVDTREKVEAFLPELDGLVTEGLVTIERADVRLYRGPDAPRE